MRQIVFAVAALAAFTSPAGAQTDEEWDEYLNGGAQYDGYSVQVWNGASGPITVYDNGAVVCSTPAQNMCSWRMSAGQNHLEIHGPNGSSGRTLSLDVTAPASQSPSNSVSDCDFQPGGCPRS